MSNVACMGYVWSDSLIKFCEMFSQKEGIRRLAFYHENILSQSYCLEVSRVGMSLGVQNGCLRLVVHSREAKSAETLLRYYTISLKKALIPDIFRTYLASFLMEFRFLDCKFRVRRY